MMIKLPVLLIAMSAAAAAQTQVDLRTQSKDVDFSNAPVTKPAKVGSALPSTCTTGEVFFNTSAAAGFNLNICSATNLWQAVGAGGAGGSATSVMTSTVSTLPSTCSIGDVRFAIDAALAGGGFYTYWCTAANTWKQLGYVGGGSGALSSNCSSLPCTIDVTAAVPLKAGANTWSGSNNFAGAQVQLPESTVGQLPSASTNAGKEFIVTDGASRSDCATGSGSAVVNMCRSNGTAWVFIGGGSPVTNHSTLAMGAAATGVGSTGAGGRWSGAAQVCFGTAPFVWCGATIGSTGNNGFAYAEWDVPANQTGTVSLTMNIEVSGGTGTATVEIATANVANGAAYSDAPTFGTLITQTVPSAATGNRTVVTFSGLAVTPGSQCHIRFARRGSTDSYTGSLVIRGGDLVYQTLN
jgi:hypothetical protein